MIFNKIKIENFRPFRGESEIVFPVDKKRNVTIVYGMNGAGKTTLLNAFLWALYGGFTKDTERPDLVINSEVWAKAKVGDKVTASIELQFSNDKNLYILRRSVTGHKTKIGRDQQLDKSQLVLMVRGEDGNSRKVDAPSEAIDQILPEKLSNFFFFNGERELEQLVSQTTAAGAEIEAGIKTILGLEVIERATERHLVEVIARFNKDLRQLGDPKLDQLSDDRDHQEEQIKKLEVGRNQLKSNNEAVSKEIEAIDTKLLGLQSVATLQKQRDALEADLIRANADRETANKSLDQVINRYGYSAFLFPRSKFLENLTSNLRAEERLPAPLKRSFIDDLLARGTCICGASITKDKDARRHLEEIRASAGLAEVEEAWLRLASNAAGLETEVADMRGLLKEARHAANNAVLRQGGKQAELSEISSKLQDNDVEDVVKLEDQRVRYRRKEAENERELGSFELRLRQAELRIREIDREISRHEGHGGKVKVAQRRIEAATESRELLLKILKVRAESVRKELDCRIKETYRSIAVKDYVPELTPTFNLDIFQGSGEDDRETAIKSTAENITLSLSFVGALASFASSQSGSEGDGLFNASGGVFPLIIDSAFGSLDEGYQKAVARALPGLVPQVILLVSKSQGKSVVEETLKSKVFERYVITLHTAKDGEEPQFIELNGSNYPYVVPDTSTYAEVVKVGEK